MRKKQKCFSEGLVKYSCYNLLLQFFYTEEEISNLEAVVPMLSCGALERSNNPYIKSIVEPSVLKNQKEILGMWI